ncbi:unnamed protein product [Cyclocybe aegerita]|uniref:Uncharacterized protein n=1 Tax=Cyclocybe aegerita TaxID=1973307 RepID=A0A8S0VTM0_CYCAE|nr:unnamed protein product [Cyclocybe aegerita]
MEGRRVPGDVTWAWDTPRFGGRPPLAPFGLCGAPRVLSDDALSPRLSHSPFLVNVTTGLWPASTRPATCVGNGGGWHASFVEGGWHVSFIGISVPPTRRLVMPTEEEPYAEAELSLLTKEKLGNLVKRQQERWPSNRLRFNLSKLRVDQLRDKLLDPKNGFSKAKASNPVLPAAAPSASALVHTMSQSDAAAEAHPTNPPPLDVEPLFRHDAEQPQAAEGSTFNQEEPLKTAIQLFLDDPCVDPVRKSAVWVHIEKHHITVDRWFVNAHAVISELQKSYSALRGPVRLAYPCPQDNSYLKYFIRSTHGTLEDGEFNPSALPISPMLSI